MPDTAPAAAEVSQVIGWTVVTVAGALDIHAAPAVRERLIDLIDTGHHRLVVDVEAVTSIDSTGLGVLVGALKRIRHAESGELRVVTTHDPVLCLMRMTQLDRVFGCYDSVVDAITPRSSAGC